MIAVPFDPDEVWGAKAEHPVGGTINGRQVRGIIAPGGSGWALTLTPMWMRDAALTAGDDVTIERGQMARSAAIWPRISGRRRRPTRALPPS